MNKQRRILSTIKLLSVLCLCASASCAHPTYGAIKKANNSTKRISNAELKKMCYKPEEGEPNLKYGESRIICAKTESEAVAKIKALLDGACTVPTEEILYLVYVRPGYYELKRGDLSNGTAEKVGFVPLPEDKDKIVAIFHNHPNNALWPSELDAITSLKYNSNCYIRDCTASRKMVMAAFRQPKNARRKNNREKSVEFGKVYEIDDNGEIGDEALKYNPIYACNGHDAYDPSQIERYRMNKLSSLCLQDNRKNNTGVGATHVNTKGEYCSCPNPHTFGDHTRMERTPRRNGKKPRHLGGIGFVCGNCGKIYKADYEKAKHWKAFQEQEGVPTQWFEIQLQQLANGKALMDQFGSPGTGNALRNE